MNFEPPIYPSGTLAQDFKRGGKDLRTPLIYFNKPGDEVEGYIVGPFPRGKLHQSCYVMTSSYGENFEIVAHQVLRNIIERNHLEGEYVVIRYLGRIRPKTKKVDGHCHRYSRKAYRVWSGKANNRRQIPNAEFKGIEFAEIGEIDVAV